MKKVIGVFAVIGVLAVLAGLIVGMVAVAGALSKPGVPSKVILEVNLETGLIEAVPTDPVAKVFLQDQPVLFDIVAALERAKDDDRVVGLVARIGNGIAGYGKIQEVRDAVERFRDSGKFAIAWSETFGEVAGGNGSYYLATAFDEIYLLPSGDIGLTGVLFESQFLSGALDKLGVKPRMDQRYEFKNAMNTFTHTEYTPAHEEAMGRLATSQFEQLVAGIVSGRGLTPERVRELVDVGPYLGVEAVDAGLVDAVVYRDEVYDKAREKAGEKAELLYLKAYLDRAGSPWDSGETIALVYGVGQVVRGKGGYSPLTGAQAMGSDTVAPALRAAIDDDRVKAIVFRVDSPGGSYVASDAIWRETIRAKEAGKPVIISMGNVAASGGYFVSMHADKIVAQPGTITGSIGVLGGKLLSKGFWDKLGISFDEVHQGENAAMYTWLQDYSEHGWARHQAWLDRVYEDFTSKVADGRGLPLDTVREIAKGRVWTGADAKERGLVDDVGGYYKAIELAREALELDADAEIRIKVFPREKTFFEALTAEPPSNSERQAAIEAVLRSMKTLQPLGRAVNEVGLGEQPGVLTMPPVRQAP